MAQPLDYVDYLSKEIGPRPAGTEEEQQAALYIADEFQKETGFSASIEEFRSSSNLEGGRAILAMVTIVVSILAMLFNVLTGPAFILALISAIIYVLEVNDRPILSKLLARGESQNVVVRYQPSPNPNAKRGQRQRKIVLVAHYDTGKVTPPIVSRVESMGLPLGMICLGGMVAAVFFLLLRIFIGGTGGVGLIFINILTIIAILIVAMPIVKAIMYRAAPYNEGANNNATGVAALIEVARRIGTGSYSEADLLAEGEEAFIHGEEAAYDEDLVPEGASITYDAPITADDFDENAESEEDRLLAAKAAIAALTGKPVAQRVYATDLETHTPQEPTIVDEPLDAHPVSPALQETPAVVAPSVSQLTQTTEDSEQAAGFENAPSWFVAAQRNAKRSETSQPVQRSRYTEAIQAAEAAQAERERAREEEERIRSEEARREREMATRAALAAMTATQASVAEEKPAEIVEEPATQEVSETVYEEKPVWDQPIAEPEASDLHDIVWEQPVESTEEGVDVLDDSEPAVEEIVEPGSFAERLGDEVDLGQTIAFTPEMIRQAIQEELDEQRAQEQEEEKANEGALDRIAQISVTEEELESKKNATARKNLVDLPTLSNSDNQTEVPENTNPSRSGLFRMLRTDVPSLSGPIIDTEDKEVQRSPLKSAAIPKIQPKAEEAAEAEAPIDSDMIIPAEEETGEEISEPGKVEMPKSRADNFMSKFRRKDGQLENTPQEWLDVDEGFEAREVGRERGSWESFREDNDRTWEGGAFSRLRLGHVSTKSGEGETADEPEELVETIEDHMLNEEIEQIYHFRNPEYNAEVWFVAIGSDTELHDGAKAFIDEHKSELRGAMIVEVESLGLGELSVATEEGQFKKIQASSRIKRFTRGASEVTGIALGQIRLATDSITTTFQKAGLQAMHLMGVEDGMPALKGSADDIVENVDEMILEENIDYLMELLKQD